jgi:hypothetical protein
MTYPGERNPFWKGGRTIASNGYVLVKSPGHHLADVRGYVYEHRLIAEKKIGRRLRKGEQVHHIDHNKRNNAESNLEVTKNIWHHRSKHRTKNRKRPLRMPGERNPKVLCDCGCGAKFTRYDSKGRPRLFVAGHQWRRCGRSDKK